MIPSWARVGAKVVCVDDTLRPGRMWMTNTRIVKGEVYTIASVGDAPLSPGMTALFLVECPNSTYGVGDDGWRISRFRPLVTIEDDIEAHFANLLRVPTNQPVDA